MELLVFGVVPVSHSYLIHMCNVKVPTMARNVPGSALYFATLHQLRYWALVSGIGRSSSKDGGRLTTAADLIAGALARSIVGLMMMPVTVVKVRYEVMRTFM